MHMGNSLTRNRFAQPFTQGLLIVGILVIVVQGYEYLKTGCYSSRIPRLLEGSHPAVPLSDQIRSWGIGSAENFAGT
jgi:hypothetical protein